MNTLSTFFTYILECADKTYYVGKTNNLEKRLRQHNGEIKGGAKYTRSRRPVVLKYQEKCESVTAALQREYNLKQLTHSEKKVLIISTSEYSGNIHITGTKS